MVRVGSLCAQVVTLVGLTACAASGPDLDAPARGADRALAAWTTAPPERCAVGSSGPTLNPSASIRNARLAAIEALAADSLAVDVQTISGESPDGSFEIAAQALSGSLADARIVALWADVDRVQGSSPRIRQVYSLACWPDARLDDLPERAYPDWLLDPPKSSDRICATGIAGPTWKPSDQRVRVLEDARRALAVALESRIEKRIFDDGHGVAKIARQVEPSAAAISRAQGAEDLERDWYDETGTGPVGLPNVLYGLACIED